jgi:hypothetical protein
LNPRYTAYKTASKTRLGYAPMPHFGGLINTSSTSTSLSSRSMLYSNASDWYIKGPNSSSWPSLCFTFRAHIFLLMAFTVACVDFAVHFKLLAAPLMRLRVFNWCETPAEFAHEPPRGDGRICTAVLACYMLRDTVMPYRGRYCKP